MSIKMSPPAMPKTPEIIEVTMTTAPIRRLRGRARDTTLDVQLVSYV
jgi:hypothetical protein